MELMSQESWDAFREREKKILRMDNVKKGEMFELLEELAAHFIMADPPAMWDGGSYGYRPLNSGLTKWRVTDGTELVDCSLLDILMLHSDDVDMIVDVLHDRDVAYLVTMYVRLAVKNQETYESKKQTADL